ALADLFPRSLALGLELRAKVAAFTQARLRALRAAQPGRFGNVACVRGNAMKHLPHFFHRAQGLVYTVTDVPELHQWMLQHFGEHPLFEPLPPAQLLEGVA
ncbi:tRNA (guanine-N(7)-)-methyltransferase-like, partial [Passer montanus]|uniref:tRNA (guanine-N(7)-)-methyltransferase-like n=1 Tax=Passer montanus TaxID=9160 RepID=UPI001960478A